MLVQNLIPLVELVRMTPADKELQIKYLSNQRKELVKDFEVKAVRLEDLISALKLNRMLIDETKEKTLSSEEYLEELENKNRKTYLDNIVKEAVRELREEREDLTAMKEIVKIQISIIKEKLFDLKLEISRYL